MKVARKLYSYKSFWIIALPLIWLAFNASATCQELPPDQIYEKLNDAVVVINSYDFNGKLSKQGSGVVFTDKGYIVTNYHVFAECERLEIIHYQKVIKYTDIIGVDVEKDILILRIDDNSFPNIPLADMNNLKVGQRVYAIGSPLGLENSMSEGIIGGIQGVDEFGRNYIQITASISPGSSGGAVVNSKGEFIGISTLSLAGGQNLNFVIPANEIMQVEIGSYTDRESMKINNLFYKGLNAIESHEYLKAISYYSECLKLNPESAAAYNNRGMAYYELEKYTEAISDFSQAIKIHPNDTYAYNNRGNAYNRLNKLYDAISDYTEVIKIDPSFSDAYHNRGNTYGLLGKYPEAIADFSVAIKLNTDPVASYVSRGYTYARLNMFSEAISDFTDALKLDPNNAEIYRNRAETYLKFKKYTEAISDYSNALNKDPDNAEIYILRGVAYRAFGNCYNAIKDWETAIGLNPAHESELRPYINRCK